MKKLSTSVSPFVVLIVPVLLVMLLSLGFTSTGIETHEELTTATIKPLIQKVMNGYQINVIQFLLK